MCTHAMTYVTLCSIQSGSKLIATISCCKESPSAILEKLFKHTVPAYAGGFVNTFNMYPLNLKVSIYMQ